MKLVMNRDITVSNTKGHSIAFEKDTPQLVPDTLIELAMAKGAVPAKGEKIAEPDKKVEKALPTGLQRKQVLFDAFESLIATNQRTAFRASGHPTVKAIHAEVGFNVDDREIKDLWNEYKASVAAAD